MQQLLRRQPDPRGVRDARIASVVLLLVFAGWLAWFGVAAPWDGDVGGIGVGDFLARFAGIVLVLALVLAPLAIAAIADRDRSR